MQKLHKLWFHLDSETKLFCRDILQKFYLQFSKEKSLANFRAKLVTTVQMEMEKIIIQH